MSADVAGSQADREALADDVAQAVEEYRRSQQRLVAQALEDWRSARAEYRRRIRQLTDDVDTGAGEARATLLADPP